MNSLRLVLTTKPLDWSGPLGVLDHGLNKCSGTNVGQRYFLAEILKRSSIAPHDLMHFIIERRIQPVWYDIALPNGAPELVLQEWAMAENNTYRSFRFLVHGSLAATQCKRPATAHGPYPTHGRFRTAVPAKCFKGKEEGTGFWRKYSFSSGPNDPATTAIQLSFRKFYERFWY